MSQFKRSPLFYIGDKYKLLNEITPKFPQNIQRWIEPFVGGGSVFLNIQAQSYCLNDINSWVIQLHQFLSQHSENSEGFFQAAFDLIQQYGLSCTYLKNDIPDELKRQHKKTYIARYNKIAFEKLRNDFNRDQTDLLRFYVLLIYGFNRMIRFNQSGNYNLPVGNVDWNTFSEYNKLWQLDDERRLLNLLDDLNRQNIRFAISNVTHYKGRVNTLFETWAQQYHTHRINSNYISYHDNSNKEFTEILVCNYD